MSEPALSAILQLLTTIQTPIHTKTHIYEDFNTDNIQVHSDTLGTYNTSVVVTTRATLRLVWAQVLRQTWAPYRPITS